MTGFLERPRTACALGGALSTISALPGVAPVIHSAIGCGGNLSGAAAFGAGYCGSSYISGNSAPTSGVTETEIVFGGSDRLAEEIEATFELIDAELFVVATGCMTEMIGDDVQGVVSEFAADGKPILAISTPSFKGDAYAGYEIVLDGILNRYLPRASKKDPLLVNIFGVIPAYDPFFRGDLAEIKRLLEALGLSVNCFFAPGETYEQILRAPQASLNIVLSRAWGTLLAERFKDRHQTPYWITDLPVGPEATDAFLREAAERLGIDHALTQSVIERENALYYGYFERAVDMFSEGEYKFYTATVTNANTAIPYARFLQRELGWLVGDVFVTDLLNEEQKRAVQAGFDEAGIGGRLLFETDTSRIGDHLVQAHARSDGSRYFDAYTPFYILGSTIEKETAARLGATLLPVSFPVYNRVIVDRGYAGYWGGLHLFEDIVDILVAAK